ncbi:MAG: recombinase family protein [Bacteroidales bacterium]|nr:recombinase family protein [Candidatus Scybalousia scybalohippi]
MEITKLPLRNTNPTRLKVAAYTRVSSDKDLLLHSLANQVSYYTELIRSNPEWEFAGIYTDEAITGTAVTKRTDFLRMLEDARAGKIDLILTKSVSRFARNTVDLLSSIRELMNLGIEVRFEKDGISTANGQGELILTLIASFAQAESESISANVKWAHHKKIEQGIPVSGVRIFGYEWCEEKGEYEIVLDEAAWVRYIYDSYLGGSSIKSIAKNLKELEVNGLRGLPLGRTTIRRILTSETYVGDLLLQKNFTYKPGKNKANEGELPMVLVTDAHKPIVSREEAELVKNIMEKRHKTCDNYGYEKSKYAGLIKCGKCGCSVNKVSRKNQDLNALECRVRKIGECDLLPIKIKDFDAITDKICSGLDNVKSAVVYDESIEFNLKNGKTKTYQRSMNLEDALSGRLVCGNCGSKIRRCKKGWYCNRRASDRHACIVPIIHSDEIEKACTEILGRDGNLGIKAYTDIEKIEIDVKMMTFYMKKGDAKLWQRT